MQDHGKVFADAYPAPSPLVTAEISPSSFPYTTDLQTVTITFTNKNATAVALEYITLQVASGTGSGALFTQNMNYALQSTAQAGSVELQTAPAGCRLRVINMSNNAVQDHTDTTLTVLVPKDSDGLGEIPYNLAADDQIVITLYGVVENDSGNLCSLTWSAASKYVLTADSLVITRAKS